MNFCWPGLGNTYPRLEHSAAESSIILDDALVYCDDDRINLMFDALSRVGKYQQIIVLTCRLRSFASLGGHTLRVQMEGEYQVAR